MEESLRRLILKEFPHEEIDIRTYSPLALAFLGDAVYSLVIRTILVSKGNRQAEKLHNETTYYVRAEQQAAIGKAAYDLMTDEEKKEFQSLSPCQEFFHGRVPAGHSAGSAVRLSLPHGQGGEADGASQRRNREDR